MAKLHYLTKRDTWFKVRNEYPLYNSTKAMIVYLLVHHCLYHLLIQGLACIRCLINKCLLNKWNTRSYATKIAL